MGHRKHIMFSIFPMKFMRRIVTCPSHIDDMRDQYRRKVGHGIALPYVSRPLHTQEPSQRKTAATGGRMIPNLPSFESPPFALRACTATDDEHMPSLKASSQISTNGTHPWLLWYSVRGCLRGEVSGAVFYSLPIYLRSLAFGFFVILP